MTVQRFMTWCGVSFFVFYTAFYPHVVGAMVINAVNGLGGLLARLVY